MLRTAAGESAALATGPQLSITIDDDGDISGSVDVVGYGGAGFGEIRYQAEISGHRT
ncbi:hypothetical protein OG320_06190 [Microbispora sp. NBC_01189]|uniref:hypothetical protein n=1 Tax=Microbispora sp. NBC_01189 TaxID=2903583 RepID=UPI002E1663D3|nr:hypothetical protein OG320_06190 [Microbispora sp. NBC_01189]